MRQRLVVVVTELTIVMPVGFGVALVWALLAMAIMGTSWDSDLTGYQGFVFAVGLVVAYFVGAAAGTVIWLRLVRRRQPRDVVWFVFRQWTPPLGIVHRFMERLFTLGWGGPPPESGRWI